MPQLEERPLDVIVERRRRYGASRLQLVHNSVRRLAELVVIQRHGVLVHLEVVADPGRPVAL